MKKNKILFEIEDPNRLRLQNDEKYLKKLEDENVQFTKDVVNLNKIQKRLREPRINDIKILFLKFSDDVNKLKETIKEVKTNISMEYEVNSIVDMFENIINDLNKTYIKLNNLIIDSDFESFAGSSKLGNIRVTNFGNIKSDYISKDFYHNRNGFKKQIKYFLKLFSDSRTLEDTETAVDRIINKLESNFIVLLDEILIFFKKSFSIEKNIYDHKLYENVVVKDKTAQEKIEHHINNLSATLNLFNKNISRGLAQDPKSILNILIKNLKDLIESASSSKKLLQYKSTIILSILMIKSYLRKTIKRDLIQNLNRANTEKSILPAVQEIFDYLVNSASEENKNL